MDKYIVFDFDGTVHRTDYLYAKAVESASEIMGIKEEILKRTVGIKNENPFSSENLSKYIGLKPLEMWEKFAPYLTEQIRIQTSEKVGELMIDLISQGWGRLYEGIEQVFDNLICKGYKLIILSNCKTAYLEAHRKYRALDRWFSKYYASQEYDYLPKTDILRLIIEDNPGEYIMIGDRAKDIEAGKNNGIKTIGCNYGYGTKEELQHSDIIVDKPEDIIKYF